VIHLCTMYSEASVAIQVIQGGILNWLHTLRFGYPSPFTGILSLPIQYFDMHSISYPSHKHSLGRICPYICRHQCLITTYTRVHSVLTVLLGYLPGCCTRVHLLRTVQNMLQLSFGPYYLSQIQFIFSMINAFFSPNNIRRSS
jgi:hypothetical protein